MKLCKLLLATLGATVLLGALVGSASARTFSTSSQTLRTAFRTVTFRGLFGNIRCQVTLEGSLHSRTIEKVEGALIGYITRAELGRCESGTATILRETLPWHAQYAGFSGELPNITDIRIAVVNSKFQIREPGGITCLATSNEEHPATGTFNRDITSRTLTTAEIGGSEIPTTCGRVGNFESSRDNVTVLGSTTRITVTLI